MSKRREAVTAAVFILILSLFVEQVGGLLKEREVSCDCLHMLLFRHKSKAVGCAYRFAHDKSLADDLSILKRG